MWSQIDIYYHHVLPSFILIPFFSGEYNQILNVDKLRTYICHDQNAIQLKHMFKEVHLTRQKPLSNQHMFRMYLTLELLINIATPIAHLIVFNPATKD